MQGSKKGTGSGSATLVGPLSFYLTFTLQDEEEDRQLLEQCLLQDNQHLEDRGEQQEEEDFIIEEFDD
jgi:hypothetical protein